MFRDRTLVRVADASDALGVSRSTAHRLLATLQEHRFVEQDPRTRAYRLGEALAQILNRDNALREYMRPYMQRLRDELNETVQLVVLDGDQARFIESVESHQAVKTGSRVGVTVPAHCLSAGKAILASLPSAELDERYPTADLATETKDSIATRAELYERLKTIRADGYATNENESVEGLASVGVALLDARGRPRAGIAVSAPLSRLLPDSTSDGDPNKLDPVKVEAIARAARNMADAAGGARLPGEQPGASAS